MKFRNLGLSVGLALGGGLILFGVFIMSFASAEPGGGLMIVLGLLFFVPGIFIAGSSLIAWLVARVYRSLGDTAKHRVRWSILLVLFIGVSWAAVDNYLYYRPSAVAERERITTEQALIEEAARAKIQATREFLIGAWRSENQPEYVIVFDDREGTYSFDREEVQLFGRFILEMDTLDPSTAITLKRRTRSGVVVDTILQVDDSQLVTELLADPENSYIEPGTAIRKFKRVKNTASLPEFDTWSGARVFPKVQPGTETTIIDGVTHRFFEEPVAVTTTGGVVRSGPGLEHSKITTMYKGDPVELIAVTDVETSGSLWYQIRFRDGQNGYALGGLLCAPELSIESLGKSCQASRP